MAPLNWQEAPQNNSPKAHADATPPRSLLGFIYGVMGGAACSLFLMGIIGGYVIGSLHAARLSAQGTPAAYGAQIPTAPTPLAAAQAPTPPSPAQPPPSIDRKADHIRGNLSKATVAVIEYSDMECPFCKRVHPTYLQIMKEYGTKVVWVYRHFPLSFHQNAQKEAEASDCASELGGNDAFWKYTDKIFERTTSNGTGFPLDNLVPLAKEIGLNEAKFKSCLDSGKYAKHVQDEEASGANAGVNGTPGNFVVNLKTQKSQMITGAQPFSAFQSAIDAALKDTGVPTAAAAEPSGDVRVIKVTAENWKFGPTVIRAKKGEKVKIELTGISGTHGFAVPDLGINTPIQPGQTVSIDLPTDKAGSHTFLCSIPCGPSHKDMKGQIVIE